MTQQTTPEWWIESYEKNREENYRINGIKDVSK